MKINVYGNGYLALAYAHAFAEWKHDVGCVSINHTKAEPQLALLKEKHKLYAMHPKPALNWICDDMSIKDDGEANLKEFYAKVREYSLAIDVPVFISTQIPLGTTKNLEGILPGYKLAYIPENVRVGRAMEYLLGNRFDRWVIGTRYKELAKLLSEVIPHWHRILILSPEGAEMTKHAINAFLGCCISFINEISDICTQNGIDPLEVASGLRSEERIGEKLPLIPGGPFKSGHLERDLKYLIDMMSDYRNFLLLIGIYQSNESRKYAEQNTSTRNSG